MSLYQTYGRSYFLFLKSELNLFCFVSFFQTFQYSNVFYIERVLRGKVYERVGVYSSIAGHRKHRSRATGSLRPDESVRPIPYINNAMKNFMKHQ